MGCKQVFAMIAELSECPDPSAFKETDLFKRCRELGIVPRTESDLEDKAFTPSAKIKSEAQPVTATLPEGQMALTLKVTDMWCPACAWFIETALEKKRGIAAADCSFAVDRLQISYDPVFTSPTEIVSAVKDLGYEALLPDETGEKKQTRALFVRVIISALLTANIMMLSFAAYSGFFIELTKTAVWKISWPICILAGVVLFYGGWPVYQKALANIRALAFGMETLITAGAFTAFFYSLFNLISGNVHIYFDTAAMLITLTLLGKLLEKRVKDRVTSDLDAFFSLQPKKAKICSDVYPDGRYASVDNLFPGDVVQVEAEDIVPADGTVLDGAGFADESVITGESRMIKKKAGDPLTGGTRITSGAIRFRVTKLGDDSVMGQMMTVMANTLNQKSSVEQYTEKILRWFVPLILSLALGTGIFCFFAGLPAEDAIIRAVTVMVIACPCALGIAIPLVRVAGISITGRSGILVRNFESFDQVEDIDTIVFDKTGTLTTGRWTLIEVLTAPGIDRDLVLEIALGLEAASDHEIAVALGSYAGQKAIGPAMIADAIQSENGISGMLGNRPVKIGSETFLHKEIQSSNATVMELKNRENGLYSPVYLSIDEEIAAVLIFGDSLRPEAQKVVSRLKEMQFFLNLVSGDEKEVVDTVARKLEIEAASGGQLPLDKAALVSSIRSHNHKVLMVGDGINDAPAMACADVSMGVAAKSLLSQDRADITLMKEDLSAILKFMAISGAVRRKIRQNFWFSFVYNFVSIPIAMSGILTPLIAVTAMLCSSLTVISNTLLLFRASIYER